MELELVTIGNELLLGLTLDTNAAEFATALTDAGVRLTRTTTVPDDGPAIRDAVVGALERTGFVVTTGGLGPTRDDVTKKIVADIFDAPLQLDTAYLDQLRERFVRWGRGPMPETNRTQAEVPRGAVQLENPRGTAPGLWLEGPLGVVVMLPGVPREMKGLLHEELVPRLRDRTVGDGARVTRSKMLRTTGVSESALADRLHDVDEQLAPVTLAYLPSLHGADLRLTAWNVPVAEADVLLERSAGVVRPLLGSWLYAEGDTDLAEVVLKGLQRAGHTLAVAESCTGGLVGERLTAIAGASAVFVGGVVAYDDAVKEAILGVPHELLQTVGAVSEEVAEAMADGVLASLGVDAAVAVTGVAGPSGGTEEKPVGTVCIAARVCEACTVTTVHVPGNRYGVRQRSAQAALNLIRGLIP